MDDYTPVKKDDVTDELVEMAFEICDGWYQNTRIDWENVLERMEKYGMGDGRGLDWGTEMSTPAIEQLKRRVRKMRSEG
ncbi:hypothetical protein ACIGXM_13985 [Kitasatospora sp. NPDC052896]|uniref:hypothetical protein n=1 Tax=Kitasatospora sp. NPDC052896 TaxID=3364061 RepID=UPI0037CB0D46